MATFAFFLNLLLLALAILNYFSIRQPRDSVESQISIDVLIPVRNEEKNIQELVASLKSQVCIPMANFYFLDDSSTDETAAAIRTHTSADARFTLMSVPVLPQGWIGKTWALQQGFLAGRAEVVVTIDADVRLEKDALIKSVNLLEKKILSKLY